MSAQQKCVEPGCSEPAPSYCARHRGDWIRALATEDKKGEGEMSEPDELGFQELRAANARRARRSFPTCRGWTASDWALALTGELGEACNLLKKRNRGESIPQYEIEAELADTLIYLDLLADHLNIDLAAAVREKFNEVSDRVGSDVRL